jgi:hypothetical protein
MNFRIIYLIVFSLLIFHPARLSSQEDKIALTGFSKGYIVRSGGDTIKGSIKKPSTDAISDTVYFKTRNVSPGIFSPFEVAEFGIYRNGEVYRSVEVPTLRGPELSFIRILMEGDYSLFYYKTIQSKHFLIRDPVGKITDLAENLTVNTAEKTTDFSPVNNFNLNLRMAFAAVPEILSKTYRVKPEKKSLGRFLKNYYNNKGIRYVDYNRFGKKTYMGIVLGTSFDRFVPRSSAENLQTFSRPFPYAGINMLFKNINTGAGFFMQSTLGYKSYHFYYSEIAQSGRLFNESFIKSFVSTTRTGFSLESVSKKGINPFIEVGPLISVLILPHYENYTDFLSEGGNIGYSYHDHARLYHSIYYGAFVRTGISLNMKNLNLLRVSLGYDFYVNDGNESLNSIDLALTYRIKFHL